MATDILRPHNSFNNFSNYYHATTGSYRKPLTRPDKRKRVVSDSLQTKRSNAHDSSSMFADVYAGSTFSVVAPSPSALPLPSFPTMKKSSSAVDDSASRDLRRLLRLE
ncbi:hypothetical protein TanjilG_26381 [Lupinus angustifolius]|uniref:Uncharacterized protein n=1 Tax=Lupinus angustifolius TaxID=3871 RepID=A0A4P1R2M5_LUPAN|nr:PREDICTED: uncharacterized protein LOC109362090 [Lupinus angustifolius]OIW00044.1 hypothetical protein TanjilG_26381 [Lupinus angustifolius]